MKSLLKAIWRAARERLLDAIGWYDRPTDGISGPGWETPGDGGDVPASCQQVGDNADTVDFAALSWDYGGFNGKNAALADGCRIRDLRVTRNGMSYSWASGGCEDLGASSRSDASCLACLFVRGADGAWRGGKFDWISTDRMSRDFENIESGYGGWDWAAFRDATARAFVIVSGNGRLRTNVIVQEGRL